MVKEATPGPIVRLRGISKTYDGRTNVLEDLDLEIAKGEFVTLLGPSGSGKTTLLMILAGFEEATGGEVLLNDTRLNRVPPYKRNMGVVFQSYALFPHMSVRKNIAYPLVQRGVPRGELDARVDLALEMIHMRDLGERLPAQLSGGQQQRVALARAIVYQPDVVLMDEPLGALDKKLRERMQVEIKRLHSALGTTVVYVTHDQSEALTMSDRIAVFNEGRIQQIGTPDEIYERPVTSFVANFIGETNNFLGTVECCKGEFCCVQTGSGVVVEGLNVIAAKPGDGVNLTVRPENIELGAGRKATGLEGHVRGLIYHGDHLRYELEVAGAKEITARTGSSLANVLRPGTEVTIGWDADKPRVLDPSGRANED